MVHQPATCASLAMTIFQHHYLDPKLQIRGTLEEDLLAKERLSIKSPYVLICSLDSPVNFQHEVVRLYKMNRLMSHIHIE